MTATESPAPAEAVPEEEPAKAASAQTTASNAATNPPRVITEVLLLIADMTLVLLNTRNGTGLSEEGRQSCPLGARSRGSRGRTACGGGRPFAVGRCGIKKGRPPPQAVPPYSPN